MKLKLFKTKDGFATTNDSPETVLEAEANEPDEVEIDPVEEPDVQPEAPEQDTEELVTEISEEESIRALSATITMLIKDEYNTIDAYSSAIQMLKDLKADESVIKVFESITFEEYAHIGELQKCLSVLSPAAGKSIDAGEEEASELLSTDSADEE